ncbi:MAG: GAF domain-containing protein [Cytophagales bacterium]|nr:MAG: GAF domain-containing protein [Cytophagales bacterium]TAF62273.1 MAG: GAF domain-containing protein [Cytophagales bacterium]
MPIRYIFGFILVTLTCLSSVQVSARDSQARFEHYSTEKGLSQNSINAIMQDRMGFLWFATQDGLNVYDAYNFQVFSASSGDTTTLSSSYVNTLFQDSQGRIWVGTSEGINLYNPFSKTFLHYFNEEENREHLLSENIKCFAEGADKRVWAGTDGGVKCLNPQTSVFELVKSTLGLSVTSLLKGKNGQIWIGTETGLYVLDPQKLSLSSPLPEPLITASVQTLYYDKKGRLWIGTTNGLFCIYHNGAFNQYMYEPNGSSLNTISFPVITSILQDQKGYIWAGTQGGGLNVISPNGRVERIAHSEEQIHSLSHDIVHSLFEDSSGTIWVGTYNGLDKYDEERDVFAAYRSPLQYAATQVEGEVLSICQLRNANVWVGTEQGIWILAPQANSTYKVEKLASKGVSFDNALVSSIFEDSEGLVWVGTSGSGLYCYNPKNKQIQRYLYSESNANTLSDNYINIVYEDRRKVIWVGTSGGLNSINKENSAITRYQRSEDRKPGSISDNNVWCIKEDTYGVLWVGTSLGLNRFKRENGRFVNYFKTPDNKSISNNYVVSIFEDSNGSVWFGTHGGGLNKYNNQTGHFEHFTEKEGLPSSVVYGICEDSEKQLWLSTNKGLVRFNNKTKQFRFFDANDGLKSNRFTPNAVLFTFQRELLVGSINGLIVFKPILVKDNQFLPPVRITDFKLFNQSVQLSSDSILQKSILETEFIELAYDQNVFSFDFVALNFRLSQKNNYAYMLENFDEDWSFTNGKNRVASYTNVPPGEYVFKVKASNNDGVWNTTITEIRISIKPPYWQTWWFRILMLVLVMGLAYTVYRVRIVQMERQKQRLSRLVKQRTRELQHEKEKLELLYKDNLNKNNEILEINIDLKQKKEEILAQRDDIERQRNELERSFNNIRILSDIGQEITAILDLEDLAKVVYEHINSLMDASGFGIGIHDEDKQILEFRGFVENNQILPVHFDELSSVNSLSVWCLHHQEEIFMNDVSKEYNRYIKGDIQITEGQQSESLIYLPLSVKNRPVGVITVQSFKKGAYTRQHLTILKTLASYISIALDNAHAYDDLKNAKKIIEGTNLAVMDSLRYAQTIQNAILPDEKTFRELTRDFFVIYQAKDMVSGDFYWIKECNKRIYMAVADCTGHGVPGAFMSMIGSRLLTEIIDNGRIYEPKDILQELNSQIHSALRQDQVQNDDGMDIALCSIEEVQGSEIRNIQFSGAKRSILYIGQDTAELLKGDRRSIGGRDKRNSRAFTQHHIQARSGDYLYMGTDGLADQHNSNKKKIGSNQVRLLILSTQGMGMAEQKAHIWSVFEAHKGRETQRDDITLLGVLLK